MSHNKKFISEMLFIKRQEGRESDTKSLSYIYLSTLNFNSSTIIFFSSLLSVPFCSTLNIQALRPFCIVHTIEIQTFNDTIIIILIFDSMLIEILYFFYWICNLFSWILLKEYNKSDFQTLKLNE